MILAEWNQVHPFPHGSSNLSSVFGYNPSISDFIDKVCTDVYVVTWQFHIIQMYINLCVVC